MKNNIAFSADFPKHFSEKDIHDSFEFATKLIDNELVYCISPKAKPPHTLHAHGYIQDAPATTKKQLESAFYNYLPTTNHDVRPAFDLQVWVNYMKDNSKDFYKTKTQDETCL